MIMPADLPKLICREVPAFDANDLNALNAAFALADPITMRQAWQPVPDPDFTPAIVRTGWRGNSLLVFAELEDSGIFTRATEHNQRMWELGDVLEIFLSAENSASYVEFHVTPNNLRLQLRFPDSIAQRRAQAGDCFDDLLLADGVFASQVTVQAEKKRWFVLAEIPGAVVYGAEQPLAGKNWRFSFSRYDYVRGRKDPIYSSTSPHTKLDYHRREEWGNLSFV